MIIVKQNIFQNAHNLKQVNNRYNNHKKLNMNIKQYDFTIKRIMAPPIFLLFSSVYICISSEYILSLLVHGLFQDVRN